MAIKLHSSVFNDLNKTSADMRAKTVRKVFPDIETQEDICAGCLTSKHNDLMLKSTIGKLYRSEKAIQDIMRATYRYHSNTAELKQEIVEIAKKALKRTIEYKQICEIIDKIEREIN